ncbi:MAG: methionyl-tRNA formyltransferase [Erysipelotrichales bacterium]|nr:methionyl-tRNA formyltransferase [Erysipelotrichales bacterium]
MNERIVFMGTASFSLEVLKMLIEEKYNVVGVVSQPDRYVGRKKVLTMPDVKVEALKYNIPVIQPQRIKEDYQDILDLKPDLIITAAYGQIIPKVLLDAPKLGCVNVHASLLPQYRGGAPVHQAIIDGQEKTGVTIMYMVAKMDAGDMISQQETPILEDDNVGVLYERLSHIGALLLKKTLPSILDGTNKRIPQEELKITYAPTISREDERINWNNNALDIYNKVRGMDPWPGSYTIYHGKVVKIWAGKIHQCENAMKHHAHQQSGTIVKIFKDAIGVKVSDGVFLITELQVEGKKRMTVKDYLNGRNIFEVDTMFE